MEKVEGIKQPMNRNATIFKVLSTHSLKKNVENKVQLLQWCIRNNYPRLVINLDSSGPFDYKNIITLTFDFISLNGVLLEFKTMLEKVRMGGEIPDGYNCRIKTLNVKYEFKDGKNVKTDEIIEQGELTLGIATKGIAYIKVVTPKMDTVMFPLILDANWFKMVDKEGNTITDPRKLSIGYSCSYINSLIYLMERSMVCSIRESVKENKQEEVKEEPKQEVKQEQPAPQPTQQETQVNDGFDSLDEYL